MSSPSPSALPSLLLLALLLIAAVPSSSAQVCNPDDEKALLAFKSAFGPGVLSTWDTSYSTDCCNYWSGVSCDAATGRLYGIDIAYGLQLAGPIPSSVGDFPTLQVLRLHKLAALTGPIPRAVTRLTKLRFLTISWTNVSGPVPSFLSQLPALEQLDLSFNNLSGSIPASLTGFTNLYAIDLSRNKLTGRIPSTLFQGFNPQLPYLKEQLPSLTLSHNGLTGSIPASFGKLDFQAIDVSRNRLTGDASFLFGRSKATTVMDLSRNRLEFDLSGVEFPESNSIIIDLSHNLIGGSIPAQVAVVVQRNFFNTFNVSYNRLCGQIPGGAWLAKVDEYDFLHNKCLCGTPLPACK